MSAVARVGTQGRAAFLSEVSEAESPVGSRSREITCAKCNLRETCLAANTPLEDLKRIERIVYARRRIMRGERLFSAGDNFTSLYAIRTGSFKTTIVDCDGREQVTGFFMTGDLLGMGGLASGRFEGTAIALEDSDVCAMPYALIEEIGREVPSLQRGLHLVLAREIVRNHGVMLLLGSMSAQERLAAFLVNLSKRYLRRGYSSSNFILRMTRDEIGSYLGLKVETVSRLFSRFHERGLLEVRQKEVRIVDLMALGRVLAPSSAGE